MKPSALFLAPILLLALGPCRAEAPPAVPASPPSAAPKQAMATVMEQWRQARQRLETELDELAKDPKQQPLLDKYRQTLDQAGKSLERLLALRSATPAAEAKDIAAATDQLKQQLLELRRIEAQIKSGTGKPPASSDLMGLVGKTLSQQQEKARSTTKKLGE